MSPIQQFPKEFNQLESLLERAELQRDEYALSQLRRFTENHPTLFQVVHHFTVEVQEKLLHYISSGHTAKKIELKKNMELLKTQLVSNHQTNILDQLMVEEVSISYLFLRYMDTLMVRHVHEVNSLDIRKADYASARFERSVKTLHKLRSILPDIHFNLNPIHMKNQDSRIQEKWSYQTLEDTRYEKVSSCIT